MRGKWGNRPRDWSFYLPTISPSSQITMREELERVHDRNPLERKDTLTATLERDYLERKAQIRADSSLSWEKQEKAIKALGDDYRTRRRELEREEAA